MEFTPIAPIRPIIDSTGTQQAGGAERAGASLFATVFQSAIDNWAPGQRGPPEPGRAGHCEVGFATVK